MGLLAVAIGVFSWYVRSVEGRQAERDQFEREDRVAIQEQRAAREALDREERAHHLNSLLTVTQIIVDIQREIVELRESSTDEHDAICGKLNEVSECLDKIMIVK
jgi:hypothetical protein